MIIDKVVKVRKFIRYTHFNKKQLKFIICIVISTPQNNQKYCEKNTNSIVSYFQYHDP